MLYTTHYQSPLGDILLAARADALVGVWLEGQKYYLNKITDEIREDGEQPILQQGVKWLEDYFAGKRPALSSLQLAPQGTEFAQEVWQLLCAIPYGQTTTYGALAKQMAQRRGVAKMSAQAVGGAVGHNPLSIIIPCHRVVGKDGSLTGYAGGLDKKIALLQREGVAMEQLYRPKKGTAL